MDTKLKIVVLAAGKGSRLKTDENDAPKVMRLACGKPLLEHVLNALPTCSKDDIIIVAGFGKEQVTDYFKGYVFAEQKEQLGTGHAVDAARDLLKNFDGFALICYGDMPIVKRQTYEALLEAHFKQGNDCTILTGQSSLAQSFGRIVRDEDGGFLRVVEDRDCTPEQKAITELNTGVYVFDVRKMLSALSKVQNNNSQGEYYLTDVPEIMRESGDKIGIYSRNLGDEILGVNTAQQLKQVEDILRGKQEEKPGCAARKI